MLFPPRLLLASMVLIVTIGFTSNAFAQDPCLDVLADNPEQLDAYDALVNEYLGASAASDTAKQAQLLDELIGVCDQNLKLLAFKGNVFAASDNCDGAVSSYQDVLSQADTWPHADNAADARKIAEDGLAKLGDKCVATVAISCPAGATVTVDAGAPQPCPANVKVAPGAHQVSVVAADGTQIHAEQYTWATGNNAVSVQGPAAIGGGGGGGGDPTPEPVPAVRADMGLQLGLSGTVGFGVLTLQGGLEDLEVDPGLGGGLRVSALFRFLSWFGIGVNLGYISSSHGVPIDSVDPSLPPVDGTLSVSAIGVGLLFRMEFSGFVVAPWANFFAGTINLEACAISFVGVGCESEDDDVVGFDVGTALLYSLEIFDSGFLEFGAEVGFRSGKSTHEDAEDDDGGRQIYVGGTIGLMYEIGF